MKLEARRLLDLSLGDARYLPEFKVLGKHFWEFMFLNIFKSQVLQLALLQDLVRFFYRKLEALKVFSLSEDCETVDDSRKKEAVGSELTAVVSCYHFISFTELF